ncbi:hypothetical protein GCM10009565_65140 [Amycolatopsis albidoflavus]
MKSSQRPDAAPRSRAKLAPVQPRELSADTGDKAKQDELTARVETYDNADGATYANHATCHPRSTRCSAVPS